MSDSTVKAVRVIICRRLVLVQFPPTSAGYFSLPLVIVQQVLTIDVHKSCLRPRTTSWTRLAWTKRPAVLIKPSSKVPAVLNKPEQETRCRNEVQAELSLADSLKRCCHLATWSGTLMTFSACDVGRWPSSGYVSSLFPYCAPLSEETGTLI